MSMNYVVRKKVDKSGDKEVVRYYAASKVLQPEPVSCCYIKCCWNI